MVTEPFAARSTERLTLRCVTPGDALATSRLMTPAISRWLASWPVPFTLEMAQQRIHDLREQAYRGDALPFALVTAVDNELVGWATIVRNERDRTFASLGFWLGERHHGKGYMREIAPVVVAAGFETLGVDVIEAGAQIANTGSFAVMKECGMTAVGERMVHAAARGQDEPCCFYEVRRPSSLGSTQ